MSQPVPPAGEWSSAWTSIPAKEPAAWVGYLGCPREPRRASAASLRPAVRERASALAPSRHGEEEERRDDEPGRRRRAAATFSMVLPARISLLPARFDSRLGAKRLEGE